MNSQQSLWFATLSLVLGLLVACQPAGTPPVVPATEETAEMPTPERTGEAIESGGEAEPAADVPEAAEAARQMLAQRLGREAATVEIISAERRDWRDSCLGIGGPNEMCLQAITPGYLVVLEVDGRTFEARTDEKGSAVRFGAAEMPEARRPLREPVVILQRSGGIRNMPVEWRLYPGGRAVKLSGPPGAEQRVENGMVPNPRQLPTLLDDLRKFGFLRLDGEYLPEDPVADNFRYTLSATVDNQNNTVEAVAGTDSVPQPVWDSINQVEALMLEIFPEPTVE